MARAGARLRIRARGCEVNKKYRSKDWGEFDAGRQYGIAADVLGGYDPMGTGNFNENEWSVFLYGIRFDNTLKYTKSVGPVTVELQYSLGEQAGKSGAGVTSGAALSYANGPFSVGAVLQQSQDASSARMKLAGAGGSWVAGAAKLYLQYVEARRDPGFAKAASNSGGALANTSMIGNSGNTLSRTDRVWTAGALWQAADAVEVTVGYMNDAIKNVASSGRTGRIATLYALADYHLSRRTDVYIGLDRTTLGGAEIDDLNGVMPFAGASLGAGAAHSASSRNGAAIGLRHKF
ncbi:MAG TPA: hypothetical protein DCW29_21910 [Janthinobacterium sp.]|nr:hypothetical protein [Janthinobacterium sp.]